MPKSRKSYWKFNTISGFGELVHCCRNELSQMQQRDLIAYLHGSGNGGKVQSRKE